MPRANRYIVPGQIYHVTHRCHDRAFLLRFGRDRDNYRAWLREGLGRHPLSLLNYCITSNHVHLILHSESAEAISDLMQLVEGSVAQDYNLRKKRWGAFWGGRFHATMIDSGEYLWRCMQYVDLNMVRAGVVGHPAQWPWGGYPELMGLRKRYRLLDQDRLIERLGCRAADFGEEYERSLAEVLANNDRARDPKWTESLAVGSHEFVEKMKRTFSHRRELTVEEHASSGTWTIRESAMPFSRAGNRL